MSESIKFRCMPVYNVRVVVLSSLLALIVECWIYLADVFTETIFFPIYIYSIIFPCVFAVIWIIFIISLLFLKVFIINNNEIKALRFDKELWSIRKSTIEMCLYYRFKWWHMFIPIQALASGDLMFKLNNGKIFSYSCCLSRKQIEKIRNIFDYPVNYMD